VLVERALHPEKQHSLTIPTEEGIQIDESAEQLENAEGSIDPS
jgi:hypothetical protein